LPTQSFDRLIALGHSVFSLVQLKPFGAAVASQSNVTRGRQTSNGSQLFVSFSLARGFA